MKQLVGEFLPEQDHQKRSQGDVSDTGSQREDEQGYRQDPSESRRESVPVTVAVFDDELNWVTVDHASESVDNPRDTGLSPASQGLSGMQSGC